MSDDPFFGCKMGICQGLEDCERGSRLGPEAIPPFGEGISISSALHSSEEVTSILLAIIYFGQEDPAFPAFLTGSGVALRRDLHWIGHFHLEHCFVSEENLERRRWGQSQATVRVGIGCFEKPL